MSSDIGLIFGPISQQELTDIFFVFFILGIVSIILICAIPSYYKAKIDITGPSEDERVLDHLIYLIEKFQTKRWPLERDYHDSLHDYLKKHYPNIQYEPVTNASRPDLALDNIAIEIKGPTSSRDLDSIASKLLKYPQHYDHIILVLFDLKSSSRYYDEWERGVRKVHPDTIILLK